MSMVVFKHPGVRMNIRFREERLAEVLGKVRMVDNDGRDLWDAGERKDKDGWWTMIDVEGKPHAIARLIAMLSTPGDEASDDSIYIMIKPKRGKKHVQKYGEEAGSGSEGGDRGEAGPDI